MGAEANNTVVIKMQNDFYLGQLTDALLRNGYTVTCKTALSECTDEDKCEVWVSISK